MRPESQTVPNTIPFFPRIAGILAFALVMCPGLADAADTKNPFDGPHLVLYYNKLFSIVSPLTILGVVGACILLYLTGTVVAAKFCFGGENLVKKTVLYQVYTFAAYFCYGAAQSILVVMAGEGSGTVLILSGLMLIAVFIIAGFIIPMHVFDTSFLRAFLYLLVLTFLISPLCGVACSVVWTATLPQTHRLAVERLTNHFLEGKMVESRDYLKEAEENKKDDETPGVIKSTAEMAANLEEEDNTPQAVLTRERAQLEARGEMLKSRRESLQESNKLGMRSYNADYQKYLKDLAAYNAKVKALTPAQTAAATPGP